MSVTTSRSSKVPTSTLQSHDPLYCCCYPRSYHLTSGSESVVLLSLRRSSTTQSLSRGSSTRLLTSNVAYTNGKRTKQNHHTSPHFDPTTTHNKHRRAHFIHRRLRNRSNVTFHCYNNHPRSLAEHLLHQKYGTSHLLRAPRHSHRSLTPVRSGEGECATSTLHGGLAAARP